MILRKNSFAASARTNSNFMILPAHADVMNTVRGGGTG
jgi:hypothetical protein